MKLKSTFLLLLLYFAIEHLNAQQTPKTLLWRITGNNFLTPSYLYGTMHSADKRVYYLGDSVYRSLKNCAGFAMEIDPGEYVDTFINSLENQHLDISYRKAVENDLIRKKPETNSNNRKNFDSLLDKLRQRYNDITPRDIARLEKAYRRRKKNDMRTALDLYLFDLAKRQDKIVGGIEDIVDQTSLKDELGNTFDADDFLKNQRKKYADVLEWMIATYTAAELDKIHDFSKQGQTNRQTTLILYNRNDKMSRRIDSLGSIRSTFCAVGAAHLPGDSGVISLLRKRGFIVTPVFSSKKIEPGDIKIDNQLQSLINISDADSNYVVQMPGKPTILTRITNKLFVKTYKELSNEILLMCGLYEDGNLSETIDKEVDELKTFFTRNDIKLYDATKINRQGLDGYIINFKSTEGYIRMHMYSSGGKTYLFAAGSKYKDSLNASRCENFLASYKMNLNSTQAESTMLAFDCPDKAFSVLLPSIPKKENINGALTYTKEDITLYSSVDVKKKISYLVLLKEPYKGYIMDFDSTVFTQTLNEINKNLLQTTSVEEEIMLDGYPALKVKTKGETEGKSHVIYTVLTIRHNRVYSLSARGLAIPENEVLFDKFINSFRFLPYIKTRFAPQADSQNLFSVLAPSPIYLLESKAIEKQKDKASAAGKRTDFYAVDSNTAMSYGITALGFDKYYWTKEGSLLDEFVKNYFNDSLAVTNVYNSDSLVYKKSVNNGGIAARELLLKSLFNNSYTRLRIMHYADSVYILNIKGAHELVTDENADIFFNSFKFTNEKFSSTAFILKTTTLLKDLQSTDTDIRSVAAAAIQNDLKFPEQDLHLFFNALLYDYPAEKNNTTIIPSRLAQLITPYANTELFGFIRTNYPLLKNKREDVRMLMINILSASQSTEAYQMIKDYLISDPPASLNYDIALNNFSRYPALAATFFPDLGVRIKEDQLAGIILELANMLIDSNKIQFSSISVHEDDIIRIAKKIFKEYQGNNSDDFYPPHTNSILQLLTKINQKQAKVLINDFLDLHNNNLTPIIIVSLIKNNQPVATEWINKLCIDPYLRIELYDKLDKIGKASFFKGEYANQKSFAEAFALINSSKEIPESIPKYFDIVGVKDISVNTVVSRFYIFKVTCQYRSGKVAYTCISGPFSTNNSELSIKEDKEVFILYQIKFDEKETERLFNDFIEKVRKG